MSLTESLDALLHEHDRIVVELFRAGAYEWSAEEQAIMTVDDVFDRLGLRATGRPWP